MSISETVAGVKQGIIDPVVRVHEFLKRIEKTTDLNAYLHVFSNSALKKANDLKRRLEKKESVGELCGIVMAVKDNINIKGQPTTCASKILNNFKAPFDATVIQKLEKADAIIIGKTNLDEFAMGSSTENSAYGAVKNPLDTKRVPGGSSGGSAVAVSTQTCDAALGSETGGSVRQPASFTGTVGLKPSYGRVSRYGLVAFASSLDQIGIFSSSVEDLAHVFRVVAGPDAHDSTCVNEKVPDYGAFLNRDIRNLTVGLPKEFLTEDLDAQIHLRILNTAEQLEKEGAKVREISLPMTEFGIATYYILATAEASSNLARYDGVRYGYRHADYATLTEMYDATRSEGFGAEVKRRILLGTYVLSSGYYQAYYDKAQRVRRLIKNEYDEVFQSIDVILAPTTPTTAFRLSEKISDPLTMYLSDIYTVTANLAGICAMSLPAGTNNNGLPFGMQLMADAFKEEKLIQLGDYIQKNIQQD